MGFLTIGRRFLGVTHDIIDDRIDVVTRGMMGLTVACARCHDHKCDPIPTRDYYSMYGVFKNCTERLVPIAEIMEKDSEFARELHKRTDNLNKVMSDRKQEAATRVRSRISDYLIAQLELEKYPEEGFDQILVATDIMPAFVRRWRDYLASPAAQHNPVFVAWQRFAALPANQFTEQSARICRELQSATEPVHATVKAAFLEPPADMHEVAQRYGKLLSNANLAWNNQSESNDARPPEHDALLQVLYAPDSPCRVPDEAIVDTERFFPTKQCEELWKLRGAVDRWLIESKQAPPHALILEDRNITTDAYVLKRGNPATPGELVPRQPLQILSGSDRPTFRHGSGRLELARAIVDPTNPLTARVAVNRIWMHHFGRGLVDTPSDFGRRAETPSHPELLDWLAARFVEDGWSLKKLHRLILLSAAYRQSSFGHKNPRQLARAQQLDPENRWLWRMNTNRLMFEELHDSALAVTGDLQRGLGGKPSSLFGSRRRTLYSQVDRQFLPGVLRVFDFATPDLHVPRRSETIVPQQALFFMNHQFLLERARSLARQTARSKNDAARVHQMYRAAYQRAPTADQLTAALGLIKEASRERQVVKDPRADQWQYGFGEYDSKQLRLINFKPLPFFDGSAWQGGPKWPDPSLGWVQLTAAGGHAGNDKQHAAVRRFTAERKMVVSIESALVHEAEPGDGVRGFLVLGRGKLLKSAEVHLRTVRFDVDTIELEAGETVDFIVDLRDNLNHEEFLWRVSLTEVPKEKDGELQAWSSERDFDGKSTKQLGPWEQLAQVLLAANEFLFVD